MGDRGKQEWNTRGGKMKKRRNTRGREGKGHRGLQGRRRLGSSKCRNERGSRKWRGAREGGSGRLFVEPLVAFLLFLIHQMLDCMLYNLPLQ